MTRFVLNAVGKKALGLILGLGLLLMTPMAGAAVDKMTLLQDENGWKLQRNGEDFYIKGVVWGYSPRGQTYTYNLWGEKDEFIKKVLDHDFGLMADAGVNAIRSFSMIPPEWITYIYEEHGIMSVVNPLMGRYGATIGGVWRPNTNYQDPLTRETLLAESLAVVEEYKDVPGVLMFAFGNESNYGLSWSSFEIEDLPVGEQNRERARFLYSLWGEVIDGGREIAPDHLFTIVNGDIQYIDLIAEYVPNQDVLGTNVYRGIGFGDLWKDVDARLDKPIVFMEFGSDAFNAKNFAEDQGAQASFLRGQWQEMYNQSYGNGGYGNAIGGFIFEWRDEWWKYKQTENLDIQDRTASWANGGYTFDYIEGQNNMNEEWFGIMRLGDINSEGVYVAEPRMAYDVMTEIWQHDPYQSGQAEVNEMIRDVDMEVIALKSDVRELKSAKAQNEKFKLVGGNFQGEFLVKGRDNDVEEAGENGLVWSDGQMVFLDFAFQPTNRIAGDFSINILGNVAESDFEFRYGDRGAPRTIEVIEVNEVAPGESGTIEIERSRETISDERVEIYDFQAEYVGDDFDFLAFYHVPRYHWGDEGDFFGLLRETTDMEGQDIWNAKAPYGFEFVGKDKTDGLKVVAGPEVYWGANPKAMIKYEFGDNKDYAFVYAEDIAQRDDSASATEAIDPQTRQATFYARNHLGAGKLELGGIVASTEKIGDDYDRVSGDDIIVDEIEAQDTLGLKLRYSGDVNDTTRAFVTYHYAGLVADGGDPFVEFQTELPYSELGNKNELELGMQFTSGDYMFYPRLFYRENIVDANPLIEAETTGTSLEQGITPRNRDDDPFAVLDNREATSAEFFFTYDPTPATWFYNWNVDETEDAAFAYNVGLTYTSYPTDTDSYLFFFEPAGSNAAFGEGLDSEDVWTLKTKMIFNPSKSLKSIWNAYTGHKQSSGRPGQDTVEYFAIDGKFIINKKHIASGYVLVDDFGPYDFQEQFNIVYPLQLKLEYAYLLDQLYSEDDSSQVGIKFLYRTLDERSPPDEYEDGENDYMFEVQTYFNWAF